jgi:hypothetical protein
MADSIAVHPSKYTIYSLSILWFKQVNFGWPIQWLFFGQNNVCFLLVPSDSNRSTLDGRFNGYSSIIECYLFVVDCLTQTGQLRWPIKQLFSGHKIIFVCCQFPGPNRQTFSGKFDISSPPLTLVLSPRENQGWSSQQMFKSSLPAL